MEHQTLGRRVICPSELANQRIIFCRLSDFKSKWIILNPRNEIKLWQKPQCALCKKLWIEESHKLAPIVGLKKKEEVRSQSTRLHKHSVRFVEFSNPNLITYQETEIKTNFDKLSLNSKIILVQWLKLFKLWMPELICNSHYGNGVPAMFSFNALST